MNNQFKERMDEIKLRTEHMAERKTYETEIDSLEDKLKGLESNYQRLQNICELNLKESALKQVDLFVAKDAHAFAETMLNKNKVLLVEERRKLDNLHWRVWEEQIKVCDEIGKCVADNDTVNLLIEYPRVSEIQKWAYLDSQDFIKEKNILVAEHPEIKQLTAEIAAMEMAITKADDSCLSEDLQKILTEISELNSNDNRKGDEIQTLIDALERSHRERMSLEAEISKQENRKTEVLRSDGILKLSQKISNDFSSIKNEPQHCKSDFYLRKNEPQVYKDKLETYHYEDEVQVSKDCDKKLKAKKWYEEYTRSIAETSVTNEDNYSKIFYLPVNQFDDSKISKYEAVQINSNENCSSSSKCEAVPSKKDVSPKQEKDFGDEVDGVKPAGVSKGKFCPKKSVKRKSSGQSSQPLKSRYFDKKIVNPNHVGPGFLSTFKSVSHFKSEKEYVEVVPQGTLNTNRKFEPLMATPSTFLKSAAETALDNYSVQSSYHEELLTSTQGIKNVRRSVKFTPKRPSNIGKKSAYRQTKLDDFDNFMLPDNTYTM